MDKLKEFLGLFRRQHFWFIAPLLLIMAVVGWMMAAGKVQSEVAQNKEKIKGYFTKATSVQSVSVDNQGHPNPVWHNGMKQLIESRTQNVENAWMKKWDRQKDVLRWPEELSFASRANEMRPIESDETSTKQLRAYELTEYKGYVQRKLPELADIIGAKWQPSGIGRTAERRETARRSVDDDDTVETVIVDWSPESQGEISRIFDWGDGLPSTLEALYAQEDFWVLTSMMDIIKATNDGARTRSSASIKELNFVRLGKLVDALQDQKFRVIKPAAPPEGDDGAEPGQQEFAGGIGGGADAGTAAEMARASGGMELNSEGMPLTKPHPGSGRYHDENFAKIESVEVLKSSLDVAKRIPVRMRIKIDQRQINRFLVACANSPLTFEVRQLRFNPSDDGSIGGGERFSREGGGMALLQARAVDNVSSFDQTIEVFGFVYIFNPVNKALLSGEQEPIAVDAET